MYFNPDLSIIVNTPTRTGSTFLCTEMTNKLEIKNENIIKTHDPELLIKDLRSQIFILRDPYDSILSMIVMDKRNGSTEVDVDIKDRISHFSQMLDAFSLSYLRSVPFTFDQIINKTNNVMNNISNFFNINYKITPLNDSVSDRHNFVKTSKTLEYYKDLKQSLDNYDSELNELRLQYKIALQFLEFRQSMLEFKL